MAADMDSSEKCLNSEKLPRYSDVVEEEEEPAEEKAKLYKFTESKESEDGDSDCVEEETQCCAGGFYDVKVFVFLLCFLGAAHGFAVNGINNVNIPMYERRFHLTSTQTGLIVSFYDIISLCMLVVAGYFMTKVNQPRLLGGAALCLTLGSLLMALPHFLTDPYHAANAQPDICFAGGNVTKETCAITDTNDASLSNYLYMFLAGQGFHGISGTLLYVVGPAFIDKSVSNKQSPTYISIFFSSVLIGPTTGYMFGGWLLTKYVDFSKQPPMDLTPDSPAWVGAWWIGFLISSALGLVIAFPLFTFPRVLPGTEARRKNNVNQAHSFKKSKKKDESNEDDTEGRSKLQNLSKALILFAKNPAFMYQCISSAAEALVSSGLTTFITKFLANQFNVDIGYSAIITGLVGVPSTFLGQICGGAVIRKFNLKVKSILMLNIVVTVIVMGLAGSYFIKCDLNEIAGVNYAYDTSSSQTMMDFSTVGLTAECNADCGCDTSTYDPVCIDGIEYFTPCHAGCSTELDSTTKTYSNCSCASWTTISVNDTEQVVRMAAVQGKCVSECQKFYIFLPLISLIMFFTFFLMVPSTTVVLRSVDESQTTFAMAVKQIIIRLVGAIPGPLLFGAILDNACEVWQESCDEEGSCWIYDKALMGRSMFMLVVIGKLISIIALGVAYKLYTPPPATTEDSESEESKV